MTIADRLRRMIDDRKTSPANVAEAAGIARQALHRILSGAVPNPGILTVEKIVEAIGGTMVELYRD